MACWKRSALQMLQNHRQESPLQLVQRLTQGSGHWRLRLSLLLGTPPLPIQIPAGSLHGVKDVVFEYVPTGICTFDVSGTMRLMAAGFALPYAALPFSNKRLAARGVAAAAASISAAGLTCFALAPFQLARFAAIAVPLLFVGRNLRVTPSLALRQGVSAGALCSSVTAISMPVRPHMPWFRRLTNGWLPLMSCMHRP